MTARLAADAIVVLHFAFIAFVVTGGLLAFIDVRWAILHVPALAWGAWTEFTSAMCPLTPWENAFRAMAGEAGYGGSFIDRYIVPLIYPQGLTPDAQIALGAGVVAINAVVYGLVCARRAHASPKAAQRRGR